MRNSQYDAYTCPSFNCYSSDCISETAVKIAAESTSNDVAAEIAGKDDAGEDFEFVLAREYGEVLSEELYIDGRRIGPVFPVFNRDLLLNDDGGNIRLEQSVMVPLGKLLLESREENDRDSPPSCSSSEADESDAIPPGTYCIWRPRAAEMPSSSPSRCKKSNSTGSASKRWKFLDLLRRSNSDGKDSFVFLTPKNREENNKLIEKKSIAAPRKAKGKPAGSKSGAAPGSPSAHEALYIRNRAIKQGEKKKSYLPYRKDLVGFFANVNGLNKGFPHF